MGLPLVENLGRSHRRGDVSRKRAGSPFRDTGFFLDTKIFNFAGGRQMKSRAGFSRCETVIFTIGVRVAWTSGTKRGEEGKRPVVGPRSGGRKLRIYTKTHWGPELRHIKPAAKNWGSSPQHSRDGSRVFF